METPRPSEPTIGELTSQQLIEFVASGAPLTQDVANHLRALSPEEREAITSRLEFDENADPGRRGWIAILPIRGTVLIERMEAPQTPLRTHTLKRKGMGRT